MRKSIRARALTLATSLLFVSSSTNAGYCDYCGQETGQWDCKSAYVVVSGVSYPAGTICTYFVSSSPGSYNPTEWWDFWDNAYAGGGAFKFGVKKIIENFVNNPIAATCNSDELTRWQHANWAARTTQAATGTVIPSGWLVRVKYDDGSTEVWQVLSPYSSMMLHDTPVPNSKKCTQ